MNTFPMIKTKLTNEHAMAGVLLVLVLYHLPKWQEDPSGILRFVILIIFGVMIDAIASLLRYKKLWCCVSGAVTAAMISLLSFGTPLRLQLLAVAIGLIVGKHLQGGTGKNITNPALLGMMDILINTDLPDKLFSASLLLLPVVILSLAFLYFRPFAGIAFMVGMMVAMLFHHELNMTNILSYGVFFWGCLVMTDPVTITSNPYIGSVCGLLSGFAAMFFYQEPSFMVEAILIVNILSGERMEKVLKNRRSVKQRFRIPKVFHYDKNTQMIDLSGNEGVTWDASKEQLNLSPEEILNRIKEKEVFGMGGAAFSTYKKIQTLLEANVKDNYLIVNAAECDPGLIHDKWLLMNRFPEIRKGTWVLNCLVEFKEIHLVAKEPVVKELAVKNPDQTIGSRKIIVDRVPDFYPVGAEKILINEVVGKKLERNQIPASSGILVLNVQTVIAIAEAVLMNKEADTRFLTVADVKGKSAKVVKVKLGMKLREIMDVVYPGTVNLYAGGGIMQAYLAEEDAMVDCSMNFIATGLMPGFKESPQCSKCGFCTKNCPSGLQVRLIAELADQGKLQEASKYKSEECISCGSCSYSCLAGHNLATRVKRVKEFTVADKSKI